MTTKYLRKDIERRFWLMYEELENYDPYVTLQIYHHRRAGIIIEVGSTGGRWVLDPQDNQYMKICRVSGDSISKTVVKAYIAMARAVRVLEAIDGA